MDYTDRDDLRQMLLDIQNRRQRVPQSDTSFLAQINRKFIKDIDLTFDESEKLIALWDKVTEEG